MEALMQGDLCDDLRDVNVVNLIVSMYEPRMTDSHPLSLANIIAALS